MTSNDALRRVICGRGIGMLRLRVGSRPGRIAATTVVAAAFLFVVGGRQSSLRAADASKDAKPTSDRYQAMCRTNPLSAFEHRHQDRSSKELRFENIRAI